MTRSIGMKRRRGSCQVAAGDEETRRPVFPRSPFFVMSMRASPLALAANYKSQITSYESSNSDRLGFLNRTLLSHYILRFLYARGRRSTRYH